jgi:pimeloyl-ACP methyl ester carboxylesterase
MSNGTDVRPFSVNVPEEDLADLRRRVAATRWPDRETVSDRSQGVQLEKLQELVRYWGTDYDWRKVEATLMTHGWPGSIIELLKVVEPLTDPTAHGGKAEDAFHLVLPTMPGYGFSGKPTTTGWGPARMASAFHELMLRLGYPRYVSQGGDWGAIISELLAVQAPEGLLGIHVNMPGTVPPDVLRHLRNFDPAPAELSDREKVAYDRLLHFYRDGFGYAAMMNQSPQTIGYALADSPVGMAAYYYDKFAEWTDSGGEPEKVLTYDEMLDAISLYWLTNTGTSSSRSYWEGAQAGGGPFDAFDIPTSRSRSPCSRPRSTARPGAGASGASATSSTGTRSTRAATSPPGSSRSCSPRRSGPRSGHCADGSGRGGQRCRKRRRRPIP